MVSVWYWCVSLQVRCFGTSRFSKIQVPFLFLMTSSTTLSFFQILLIFCWLLIFFRCKDNCGYLGLMLLCFTVSGGLKCFFRMRYHIFQQVTVRVTTHFNIPLWEYCTVSNAPLLLACYCIVYCMTYYTFSVK